MKNKLDVKKMDGALWEKETEHDRKIYVFVPDAPKNNKHVYIKKGDSVISMDVQTAIFIRQSLTNAITLVIERISHDVNKGSPAVLYASKKVRTSHSNSSSKNSRSKKTEGL